MRLGVRAVAAPGGERVVVDPEEVAAVGARGAGEATRDRHARHLTGRGEPLGLALALRLGHLQDDRPRARDEHRVVREHGVDEPVGRRRDHDLAAEIVEQLAERLVLALQQHGVGLAPAGGREIALQRRRRDEHPAQGRGHRAHAVRRYPWKVRSTRA